MRNHIFLPVLTGVFGALGLALRQLQLRTGFDAYGLPVEGAIVNLALPLCTAAFLLCITLPLLKGRGRYPERSYDQAFASKDNAGAMTAAVSAAALLVCGAVLALLAFTRRELPNLLHLVLGLLMAASGGCLVGLERSNYRGLGRGRYNSFFLLGGYTAALWVILTYQACSGEPVLQQYVYYLLAAVFVLLALYFTAGYAFEKGKALPTLWSGLCASYFCAVSLLDGTGWHVAAYQAAFLVYFISRSAVLLRNLTAEREESTDE